MITYYKVFKEIPQLLQTALFNLRREGFIFTCKYFPYHLKMRLMEINEGFDLKYGTETSKTELIRDLEPLSSNIEGASVYAPTIASVFEKIMGRLAINHADYSFIDLGSGKGRALLLASKKPFKKIIGVEFCKKLHEVARKNIATYQVKTGSEHHFELHLADVATYSFPPGNLLLYLFNPFDEKVVSALVENLRKAEAEAEEKRKLIIIYSHPLFDKHIESLNIRLLESKKDEKGIYGWKIYSNA